MGLAKRTAHATTATLSAIAQAQECDCSLAGIPANYFDNRADQLYRAADALADEQDSEAASFAKDKAALAMEHELAREELLRQIEREKAERLAELERQQRAEAAELAQDHEAKEAELEQEHDELARQARDFRRQAKRYSKNKLRCSYLDCLKGAASVPQERAGKLLFQALMIGGMVLVMTSFNGVRHSGLDFFASYHWMYPLYFCMTFMIRELFMNDFTGRIIGRLIAPRFDGWKKASLITVLNVGCMVPLMTTVMTGTLYGFDGLGATLAAQVPLNVAVALGVNYFLVGPFVKMFYNNVIVANREGETGTYTRFQQMVMPMLSAFNS